MKIRDWRGIEVEVGRSAGGVLAVANPWDNLVRTGISPWPAPELLQKLYQSRQARAFRNEEHDTISRVTGFYSDLQSLHSEDAITWSVFGPACYASVDTRVQYAAAILSLIGIDYEPFATATVWLWRRLPHPETLVSGGPEIDFGIQTPSLFLLGEAKWLSGVDTKQGVNRNKTQLELRQEFCERYGPKVLPDCTDFVVLSVSLGGGLLPNTSIAVDGIRLHARDITWHDLIELKEHPLHREISDYFVWKRRNSRLASDFIERYRG